MRKEWKERSKQETKQETQDDKGKEETMKE